MLDQVIVDRERLGVTALDRLGQAGAHRGLGQGPREEPSRRGESTVGVDSSIPASFSRATSAATDDFERRPRRLPIDEYEGSARCRA